MVSSIPEIFSAISCILLKILLSVIHVLFLGFFISGFISIVDYFIVSISGFGLRPFCFIISPICIFSIFSRELFISLEASIAFMRWDFRSESCYFARFQYTGLAEVELDSDGAKFH